MEYDIILHLLSAMNFLTTAQPGIESAIQTEISEEKATIVHCILQIDLWIRMWPTTHLVQQNGRLKKMLHIYNIGFYPETIIARAGYKFTLVFEGLDTDCIKFDLVENADEKGGFIVSDIMRNSTDVYTIFIGRENLQS